MATGTSGDGEDGLARRAATHLSGLLDPSSTVRRQAGGIVKTGGIAGGATAAGVLGLETVGRVDPAFMHALVPLAQAGGAGLAGGVAVGLAISAVGGIALDEAYSNSERRECREATRNWLRRSRTVALVAGVGAAAAAFGIEGGSALAGLHNAGLVQGLSDAAAAAAGVAAATHATAKLWGIGLPKPEKPEKPRTPLKRPPSALTEW